MLENFEGEIKNDNPEILATYWQQDKDKKDTNDKRK
jgi:hypothetical protein